MIIAEFCDKEKVHIVSVYKLIQDLLAPSGVKNKNLFQLLIEKLPPDHKARWFAGAALSSSEQAMASALSTALSRLNNFLDSEMEQILCFDTKMDSERFCKEKSAIFVTMPEEDSTKYFMVSLIIQQINREILTIADECGGKLPNRVMMYLEELGTLPPLQSAEMFFSSSRSRKISIVASIQSISQLEKNYGEKGADIIIDNCQLSIFGGFAPQSSMADTMSKNLGDQTVLSGSVTRTPRDGSQNLQMISRPLMSADELRTLPKFNFIVGKTGCHPFKTKLPLFFEWGIKFDKDYILPKKSQRKVAYADREEIMKKLNQIKKDQDNPHKGDENSIANKARELARQAINNIKQS